MTLLYSARASLIIRSRCCCAWFTSSQDGFTGSGGLTSCSTTCSIVSPISYSCTSASSSSSTRTSIAWRPMVSTSVTVRSPTTWRITASFIARKVPGMLRTRNRYRYGSEIRYCTIHSTTATLRSPVSITASCAKACGAYSLRRPAPVPVVRKPNSSFSCRCTGIRCTFSTNGSLTRRPGSLVRMYRPKRTTTPTSSGCT